MEYGIIGEHLPHTFSKKLHEEIAGYNYEVKELNPKDLASFLNEKNFKGINVTIPFKQDVIPFLDIIDDSVKHIGACNVIVNEEGKLHGYNVDYIGFIKMIDHFNIDFKDKRVAILGTGGTSKTVNYVCKVKEAKEVVIVSRNEKDNAITYADLYDEYGDIDIIVNTTPRGMFPNNEEMTLNLAHFTNLEAYVDVIYNPLRTMCEVSLRNTHIKIASGLFMLVAQGVETIELFTKKKLDPTTIESYFNKINHDKENIVLIGMPTSGKTTVGKLLAERLNREFIDTDEEIKKEVGDIATFIKDNGEELFRDVETGVIVETSKKQSLVIATGGGSILRNTNILHLKQNGKVFFLDRSLENLLVTEDRPLSSSKEALEKRYKERYEIYKKSADVIIDGNKNIEEVADDILKRR